MHHFSTQYFSTPCNHISHVIISSLPFNPCHRTNQCTDTTTSSLLSWLRVYWVSSRNYPLKSSRNSPRSTVEILFNWWWNFASYFGQHWQFIFLPGSEYCKTSVYWVKCWKYPSSGKSFILLSQQWPSGYAIYVLSGKNRLPSDCMHILYCYCLFTLIRSLLKQPSHPICGTQSVLSSLTREVIG